MHKSRKLFVTFILICSIFLSVVSVLLGYALNVDVSTFSGSGTFDDPYLISTASDFYNIRYELDKYYIQTDDIDLSGYENFAPIGTTNFPFTGTYNGNLYTITNLKIDGNILTAASDGEITIFALADGIVSQNFLITAEKEPVTRVEFIYVPDEVFLHDANQGIRLQVKVFPDNATYQDIVYSIEGFNTIGAFIYSNILFVSKTDIDGIGSIRIQALVDGIRAFKTISILRNPVESISLTLDSVCI